MKKKIACVVLRHDLSSAEPKLSLVILDQADVGGLYTFTSEIPRGLNSETEIEPSVTQRVGDDYIVVFKLP